MAATNSDSGFGWVTRALHWITAALVLTAIPFGLWLARMEPSLAALKYFGWHKTLGISILALILIRLAWHRITPPPAPIPHKIPWQDTAARVTHRSLYLLLLAMPLSGWIASSATGIPTIIFDRWTLPRIAPISETWETTFFAIHGAFALLLAALITLHIAAALYRGFILKDGTLSRMTGAR